MPQILLLEDNELNRDMFSRHCTSGAEWLIPLRAYSRAEFVREITRLLGAPAAREVPPGEERPR